MWAHSHVSRLRVQCSCALDHQKFAVYFSLIHQCPLVVHAIIIQFHTRVYLILTSKQYSLKYFGYSKVLKR